MDQEREGRAVTEDQIFRERIRNWVRAYTTVVRWKDGGSFLSKFTDLWREERYRDGGAFDTVDLRDAEVLERAWRTLEERDKMLIKDWYVLNLSIGKIARRNACFYRDVMARINAAERRFRVAVNALQEIIDKQKEMSHNGDKS